MQRKNKIGKPLIIHCAKPMCEDKRPRQKSDNSCAAINLQYKETISKIHNSKQTKQESQKLRTALRMLNIYI